MFSTGPPPRGGDIPRWEPGREVCRPPPRFPAGCTPPIAPPDLGSSEKFDPKGPPGLGGVPAPQGVPPAPAAKQTRDLALPHA